MKTNFIFYFFIVIISLQELIAQTWVYPLNGLTTFSGKVQISDKVSGSLNVGAYSTLDNFGYISSATGLNNGTGLKFETTNGSGSPWGATRMTITNHGRVGIGTDKPFGDLELYNNSGGQCNLRLSSSAFNGAQVQIQGKAGMEFYTFETGANNYDDLRLHYNSNWQIPIMSFKSGGQVGIGTGSPFGDLEIQNSKGGQCNIRLSSSALNGAQLQIQRKTGVEFYTFETGANNYDDLRLHYNSNWQAPIISFKSGGQVGIGTGSPFGDLEIQNSQGGQCNLRLSSTGVNGVQLQLQRKGGIEFYTFETGANNNEDLRLHYNNNWQTPIISFKSNGNVAIYGKLEAKEIKVTTSPTTADFVFDSNYKLHTLNELEKFIIENKHLPEIASASEMKENGLNIAEFQIKLLQKIEELTLHIIEQQKQIDELKRQK